MIMRKYIKNSRKEQLKNIKTYCDVFNCKCIYVTTLLIFAIFYTYYPFQFTITIRKICILFLMNILQPV